MSKKTIRKEYRLLYLPIWRSKMEEEVDSGVPLERQELPAKPAVEEKPTFVVGSWLLQDCQNILCRRPDEDILYVSGLKHGSYLMCERITKFELESQTPVSVRGDISSCFDSLTKIEDHGYHLALWLHSHPGKGSQSAFASSTDMRTQRNLEAGKYSAIGGVFARDGHIRFFSDQLKFNLIVLGKGVQQIDANLFKLATN